MPARRPSMENDRIVIAMPIATRGCRTGCSQPVSHDRIPRRAPPLGISNVIYVDPGYDITEEVAKEINKDRPANAPTAPAATPSAPAANSGSSITVPLPKK